MATEEARRARLHREASEAMSPESADLMLGNFPPAGDRVATKTDLDVLARLLEHKIDGEVAELRGELRAEVAGLRAEVKDDLRRLQGSLITTMLAVNSVTVAVVFGLVKLV